MKTLYVDLGERSYPIYIGSGLLARGEWLSNQIQSNQVMVVTNETVAPLYLAETVDALGDTGCSTLVLADGEQYKTLDTVGLIFDELLEQRFNRNATLIALGGGVIGDMVGFSAACYQRGIPFIQMPTTLLAQVDSSVGGKTGVNHRLGKNMIGAFNQPCCVIADTLVLETLDNRQLSAGLAEVIKYGLIRDAVFFAWLEDNMELLLQRQPEALAYAIERSCVNKAEIVAEDERESGVRAILNLGHTFGHAIEAATMYRRYLHGEAVAIGICQAADLSRRIGFLSDSDVNRVVDLLERAALPVKSPADIGCERYLDFMAVDKKNIDGSIRLILLKDIGDALLPSVVDSKALMATLNEYGRP